MTIANHCNSPNDGQTQSRALVPVVHNTNLVPLADKQADPSSPTAETYGEFRAVYDFMNEKLFSGSLPPCLITLQRHSFAVMGYYSPSRFVSNRVVGATTDEIALNPIHFKGRDATEVLQTLVHEMCHLWQWHFGKPSRRGYHNKEWAKKMEDVGLMPSSTGNPGGARTGQHMGDFLIEGGPFDTAVKELLQNRFRISWYDRLAEFLQRMQQPQPNGGNTCERPTTYVIADAVAQLPGRRAKFTCPACKANAWGKPSLKLICADCDRRMLRS